MKVKTIKDVRKETEKEIREKYYKDQYHWMINLIQTCAEHTTVCALAVLERRNLSKKYVKKFFEDLCMMYSLPVLDNTPIKAEDMKKYFEEKYDISFDSMEVHFESEEEFLKKYL